MKIVVVGGGIIGSSIAYFVAEAGYADRIVVVEPDPTYTHAATPRAVGTVRRIHGIPENIEMSQFGHAFYSNFSETMSTGTHPADVSFRRNGFTFMVWGSETVKSIERIWRIQQDLKAPTELLDRAELKRRFPSTNVDDVDVALHGPEDGWIDPYGAMMGFRHKVIDLGVRYVKDKVVGFEIGGNRISHVVLESGDRLDADIVINAANCWAPDICAMVGMRVPIEPMRRQTFNFDCRAELDLTGVTRDLFGVSFRPEGSGYIVGLTKPDEPGGFNWDIDHAWFEEAIWPRIAHRVPAFEAVKLTGGWSGHYDQNRFDGQPILGPWIGGIENFYLAAGFSGHGLQHAPAVGRAFKELLIDGAFSSIDLTPFSYQRILDNKPMIDAGPPT